MSEEDNNNEGQGDDGGNKSEFTPITSQEEFDKALGKRLDRERARFADYDDLKTKAAEYDKVQDAAKSELEKANERAAAAEQRAGLAELASMKARIAAEENVPVEVLHGDDEDTIRAAAAKVKEWAASGKKPAPNVQSLKSGSTSEDTSGLTGPQKAAAALRNLRSAGD